MDDEKVGSVPIEEQETTINYCRADDWLEVWTSDRTVMTKLDKLCIQAPDNYKCKEIGKDKDGYLLCKTYSVSDKGLLTFREKKRKYSAEYRAELAARLRSAKLAE